MNVLVSDILFIVGCLKFFPFGKLKCLLTLMALGFLIVFLL